MFEFEIILNVLVTTIRFICIPVMDQRQIHNLYFSVPGDRHQILTSKVGPRTKRDIPWPVELIVSSFHPFEAGIAKANFSFK